MTEIEIKTAGESRFARLLAQLKATTSAAFSGASYVGIFGSGKAPVSALAKLKGKGPDVLFPDYEAALSGAGSLRGVALALPRRFFLARDAVLPGTVREELAGMIRYELPGLFPVAPEELIWDWYPRSVREDGYTVCRVFAIESAIAAQELENRGLRSVPRTGVLPSTVALANLYLSSAGRWPERPELLVSVTSDGADFAVVGPGGIECDRGVAGSEAPPAPGETAAEAAILLSIYRQDMQAGEVSRVLLVDTRDSAVAKALSDETGLPVEMLEPPAALAEGNDGVLDADRMVAAGAALGPLLGEGLHLKFEEPERARHDARLVKIWLGIVSAVLFAFAFAFAMLAFEARMRRTAVLLDKLEARAAEIAPAASAIDAKRERLSAIQRQLSGQGRALDVLVTLYKITPPDVYLTSVEIDAKGLLTIKGHVQELFRASEYAVLLEKEPVFGKPAQQGPRAEQTEERGKSFITFRIVRDISDVREP